MAGLLKPEKIKILGADIAGPGTWEEPVTSAAPADYLSRY